MEYSSGIIIYRRINNNIEFFVCTPGGPFWKNRELWNFPKGHIEDGECPFDAALREFKEETSVTLNNDYSKYKYHGLIKQNSNKKVHVFSKEYSNEDFSNCYSNECETIFHGKTIIHKEIKDYKWMSYDELLEKGIKSYNNILKELSNG